MNKYLKNALEVLEKVAVPMVPGGAAVGAAIHAAIDAKGSENTELAVVQAVLAALGAAEKLGADFADEPNFQFGLMQMNAGAIMMVKAIKAKQAEKKV